MEWHLMSYRANVSFLNSTPKSSKASFYTSHTAGTLFPCLVGSKSPSDDTTPCVDRDTPASGSPHRAGLAKGFLIFELADYHCD